ncbi:hypothetical protein L916_01479, partial [Phytophthora nicotianae]
PKGSTLTSSDTASFAQAQHRDAKLGEEQVEEESDYDAVNIKISGSKEIPLTFT